MAFVAVAALVLQPAYSLLATQVANALGGTVVTTDLSTWDLSETRAKGHNQLVSGGLHVWTDGSTDTGPRTDGGVGDWNTDKAAGYYSTPGLLLSDVDSTSIDFASYTGGRPSVQLGVDRDGNGTWDGYLVYEPWAYGDGQYWTNKTGFGVAAGGGYESMGTLAQYQTANPNAKVTSIGYSLGSGVKGDAVISKITIGGTDYTFGLPPYVPTAVPTRPTLSGNVIYDSTPLTLPSNLPSEGFQATQTRALGDKIAFAGSDRALDKVAVTLSSWACQNGSWTSGCVTTPGATFSHPVTLNIYNIASDGSVGSLIASKTQTFDIPYRPTADPTCSSASKWRDTNGDCFNGLNHVVVFDASGIVVPDSVIYSIAYNTQSYGTAPIGVDGPYSSLNVSLATGAASVGTNVNTDEVFWDSTYGGRTAGLTVDGGWNGDGNPAVTFTAKPLAVPANLRYESPNRVCGAFTNINYAKPAWDAVDGAVSYDYQALYNGSVVYSTNFASNQHPGGTFGGGQNGEWAFQVRSVFAGGVKSAWSTSCSVTLDTTTPAAPTNLSWKTSTNVTVANNGTTNIYDGAALWQASASSDVDHYVYKYWNDITGNQYKVGSEYVTTTSATSLPGVFNQGDGVHHFCIASVDRAGNTSACTAFAITYDATAPTAPTITSPTTGDEFASSVDKIRANWTASTDTSGIAKYQIEYVYTRNGSETTDYRDVAANRLYRDQSLSGSVLSDFTIRVRAQDKAGNWSDWSDPVTYYYGVPAPTNETEEPGGTGTNPPETNQGGSTQNQGTGTPAPASSPAQQLFALQPAATPAQILAAAADGNTDVLGVTDNESTPTVKGASDQAKTLASTANPEGVLGASDNKLFGLVWYWWLLIVAAVVAAGWWIIAAARRRRDGDDA